MKAGSLFSGYLGLDRAVEEVFGAETVWTSDIDPGACKIIAHRYPNIPNMGDITTIDWTQVEPVDVLTGGWPCQPFSVAGKRKGAADERALWPYVADAVRTLRPRWVVLENVAAIATGHAGELSRATADLSALGYVGSWLRLRASDVGAPHGRARCFILATDTGRLPGQPGRITGSGETTSRRPLGAVTGRDRTPLVQVDQFDMINISRVSDSVHVGRPPAADQPNTDAPQFGADRVFDHGKAGVGLPGGDDRESGHIPMGTAGISEVNSRHEQLLPTPTARDWKDGRPVAGVPENALLGRVVWNLLPTPRSSRGGSATETMYGLGAERSDAGRPQGEALLPTPRVSAERTGRSAAARKDSLSAPSLQQAIELANGQIPREFTADTLPDGWRKLLPTPTVVDSDGGRNATAGRSPGAKFNPGWTLSDVAYADRFGQYSAAVARWELIIGRPAPDPTVNGRLSPQFVEFMMGLPAGWVTDVPGLTRSQQLKALGNGVVPQQAAAALTHMISMEAAA